MASGEWLGRKLLDLEQQVAALSRGTRLGNSSLHGRSILAMDEDGHVLAELGSDGGAGGILHLDGPTPPRPTAPQLELGIGSIFVRWDGRFVDGDLPMDFDRIEVHATTDPELNAWDEDTLAGSITQRTGGVVLIRGWDVDDEVFVRLVCRSLADKLSETSDPAQVTVTGINLSAITDELDAANLELSNLDGDMFAVDAELDALQIQFKNLDASIINTDDGVLSDALADAREALESVQGDVQSALDAAIAAEEEVSRVRNSVDGKNSITQSTDAPPTQYDGAVGDRWERMSSMGSGGSLISNWRWNGDVWVSTIISDAVLGNVDAAKIGTGYLDAARIEAESITADKLLIGGASNMVANPGFESGMRGWVMSGMGVDENQAHSGTVSAVMTDIGQSGTKAMYQSQKINVVAGDRYRVSVWARVDGDGEVGINSGGFRIHTANDDGTPGAEYTSGWRSDRNWASRGWDTPGEWFWVSTEWEAPETDAIILRIAFANRATPGTRWVDDFAVTPMTGSTLIEDGAITTDKIAANAIGARAIAADAIEAGKVAADAISGREIIANAIKAEHIAALTITAGKLAANSVSTEKLVSGSVIADKIAANAITAEKINALAVTADKIAVNAVTADKIAANAITAGKVDADAINGMTITGATIRTAATGARVELNPQGISAWNSGDVRTFNVSQTTGEVEMVGDLYSGLPGGQRVVIDDSVYNSNEVIDLPDGGTAPATGAGILFGLDSSVGRHGKIGYNTSSGTARTTLSVQGPYANSGQRNQARLVLWDDGRSSLRSIRRDTGGVLSEITSYPDGLMETRVASGSAVRLFPNGQSEFLSSSGAEMLLYSDGVAKMESSGGAFLKLYGSKEVDLSSPGGAQLMMYPSGTGEFRNPQGAKISLGSNSDITLSTSADLFYHAGRHRADYNSTTGSANVRLTPSGYLGTVGSSERYKIAVEPLDRTVGGVVEKLLSLEPKTWIDRSSAERHSDRLTALGEGVDNGDDLEDTEPLTRIPGVIAEDLHDAGLGVFVEYNDDGAPESVMYDRLGVAWLAVAREMHREIQTLKERLDP